MSTAAPNSRDNNRSNTSLNISINSTKISQIVSKEIKKIKNSKIGVRFEENIRKTLN